MIGDLAEEKRERRPKYENIVKLQFAGTPDGMVLRRMTSQRLKEDLKSKTKNAQHPEGIEPKRITHLEHAQKANVSTGARIGNVHIEYATAEERNHARKIFIDNYKELVTVYCPERISKNQVSDINFQ